jgi:hypothetical protein
VVVGLKILNHLAYGKDVSTCESVTGEESGFKGANNIGGKPEVEVYDSINLGEHVKTLDPVMGLGLKEATE